MAVQLNFSGPKRRVVKDLEAGQHDFTSRPTESLYFLSCKDVIINVNTKCCKVCELLFFLSALVLGILVFAMTHDMLRNNIVDLKKIVHRNINTSNSKLIKI